MQSPYVPETPGRSPVIPEEVPETPTPEIPVEAPGNEPPLSTPPNPDQPEGDGERPPEAPEALSVRIP